MARDSVALRLLVTLLVASVALTGCVEDPSFVGSTEPDDPGPREPPPEEDGRFNGTVSSSSPNQTHVFNVTEPGHGNLSVGLAVSASSGGQLRMSIEGPNGTRDTTTLSPPEGGSGGSGIHIGDPASGRWLVDVSLEQGQLERYRVDWCASEALVTVSDPGPQPGPPCE